MWNVEINVRERERERASEGLSSKKRRERCPGKSLSGLLVADGNPTLCSTCGNGLGWGLPVPFYLITGQKRHTTRAIGHVYSFIHFATISVDRKLAAALLRRVFDSSAWLYVFCYFTVSNNSACNATALTCGGRAYVVSKDEDVSIR